MTLREKVGMLVRYCGQHQSHGFMMDERNTDEQFNIELPEEGYIRRNMKELKVVLLTGEAGDGKSRIMRNLKNLLEENGFTEPCGDFSALQEDAKAELLARLKAVLEGNSSETHYFGKCGYFTQAVIQFCRSLMDELTKERKDIYVCNFESRNLAGDEKLFGDIVKAFLCYGEECDNADCPCFGYCSYKKNIDKILSPAGIKAMRTICDPLEYYLRTAQEISDYPPHLKILTPAVKTEFAEIKVYLLESQLFRQVDHDEDTGIFGDRLETNLLKYEEPVQAYVRKYYGEIYCLYQFLFEKT